MTDTPTPKSAAGAFNLEAFRDVYMPLVKAQNDVAAEKLLRETLALYPQDPELQYEAGVFYNHAADRIEKNMRFGKGAKEQQRKNLLQAFHHYARASDEAPERYTYAYRAGYTGRVLGGIEAMKYLHRAIAIENDNIRAWYQLGRFEQLVIKNRKQARACFENVLRIESKRSILDEHEDKVCKKARNCARALGLRGIPEGAVDMHVADLKRYEQLLAKAKALRTKKTPPALKA